MNQIVPKEVCKSVKKTFNVCSPQGYANKNCSQSPSIPTKGRSTRRQTANIGECGERGILTLLLTAPVKR